MPTPPLDARDLIRRAREAAGGHDILSGLPGAVVPLAEFFANHVDLRPQREKNILRMRASTAAAVWLRQSGAGGKAQDQLSDALSGANLGAFLEAAGRFFQPESGPAGGSDGAAGVIEEIEKVREAASGGTTSKLDKASAGLFIAIGELGRGPRCNEWAKAFGELEKDSPLKPFFETIPAVREKEEVVEQAIQLLDQSYAHLNAKRELYAIDPIQRLRLARRDIPDINDTEFHGKILDIFKELHDPHTSYILPSPFKNRYAFLPFLIEDCGAQGNRKFVVSSVIPEFYELMSAILGGSPDPTCCGEFGEGAEILYWNGALMERAVWRNAEREAGSNAASRFARSVAKMTVRSLSHSLPPEEDWVTLSYLPADAASDDTSAQREIIVPWAVWEGSRADLLRHRDQPKSDGVNEQFTELHELRKRLWAGTKSTVAESMKAVTMRADETGNAAAPPAAEPDSRTDVLHGAAEDVEVKQDPTRVSSMPELIEFAYPGDGREGAPRVERLLTGLARDGGKRIGYLRIRSFDAGAKFRPEVFFGEMLRIAEKVMEPDAPDGLIIDVRGNSGGIVKNGEKILQLFTPHRIEPARFHYRSTELLRDVADRPRKLMGFERQQPFAAARESLHRAIFGGGEFSDGFPLTDPSEANDTGQRYSGPVALIVDGMCYSATDIFVAGFKDNRVAARGEKGKDLIIGTDSNIGAGGAARWTHEDDLLLIGEPFAPLPPGYGMTVAIQRSTRAGTNRGTPLEDLGVVPDFVQPLTKRDLLESNEDLIRFVCGLLSACPRFHVEFNVLGTTKPENRDCLAVHVKSQNVERIECRVDGVVQLVRRVVDGEIVVEVPLDNTFPERFELQGFNKVRGESVYELKAARKRALTSAQRRPFRGDLAAGAGS